MCPTEGKFAQSQQAAYRKSRYRNTILKIVRNKHTKTKMRGKTAELLCEICKRKINIHNICEYKEFAYKYAIKT